VAPEELAERLSAEERRRGKRFLRPADRQRFIVSHAALRTILGQHLGIPTDRVEMKVGPQGKPALAPAPGLPPLRYNLSHSEGLAMIALVLGREVGLDVERVRPLGDAGHIVGRYFSPGEQAAWCALPDHQRLPAFFRCWTRKEAYLKARGIGLSAGLDRFQVSLGPDEPPRLLWVGDPTDSVARWQMYDVSSEPEYMAACVVEQGVERLSLDQWPRFSLRENSQQNLSQ
jgi:4'-phosphopantetheinyl transferase